MELLQLKYFKDAFVCKNFSRTAEKFCVPQSAVSQSIKRLEEELGVQLFTRHANKITPNECGKIFYNYVNTSLTDLEKGINIVKRYSSALEGEICVKVQDRNAFILECISDFKKIYPSVDFIVYHQNPSREEYSFDFVVSADKIKDITYEKIAMFEEKILLAVPKNYTLAQENKIKLEYIKNAAFISMQMGHNLYNWLRNIFQTINVHPNITISCDDPHNVRKYVKLGLGVTLFPEKSWEDYTDDDFVTKEFENVSPQRTMWLYYKKSEGISDAAARFKNFVIMKSKEL